MRMRTCMHAGQKIKPHLIMRKVMQPPERYFASKQDSKALHVIAFINLKGGMFVKLLTGSSVPPDSKAHAMLPCTTYYAKSGQKAARMTATEYKDCVEAAVEYFAPKGGSRALRTGWLKQQILVQDRSTCHPRESFKLRNFGTKLKTITAPPRSPDMMPLDYAVFGTVKRELMSKVRMEAAWGVRVEYFLEALQRFNPKAAIQSYPSRLLACARKGGGRVDKRKL